MRIRYKLNIFAIILFMIVLASIMQLDFLRNSLFQGEVRMTNWVQHTLWQTQSDACTTECGAETAKEGSYKPEKIQIASVKIDLPVVSVPLKNGTWDVLPGVANYAEGTSFINDKEGNVGLFGHAQSNAFKSIKDVKKGDTILLSGNGYKATYIVTQTKIVPPTKIDVFYPEKIPVLTLITCDGPADEHRLMVRAKLIKLEKFNQ